MATPTIREALGTVASTSVTVTTGAGTAVGDWLFVLNQQINRPAADLQTPTGTAGTWTQIATADSNPSGDAGAQMAAWMRRVTVAGAQTINCNVPTSGNTNSAIVLVVVGAHSTAPLDGSAATASGVSATSEPIGSVSPTTVDALLIASWGAHGSGLGTYTPPATMTERRENNLSSNNAHVLATQALVASGSTGSRTATTTAAASTGWVGIMFAAKADVTPVDLADSGAGDDPLTVDQTEIRDLTEAALSADPATVLADHDALTDSGASSETITVDQLIDVVLADAGGVGADSITVANFFANDLVDSGAGADAVSLVRTNFADLVESGPGVDAIALERQLSALADSGAGVDESSVLSVVDLADSGVGTDEVSVVDIPFTAFQPLVEGRIYDLVVVGRVPQASGPPTFIEVDPIEWKSLTYASVLKEPQELSASCLISSVPESIWQRLRALHELATELWLYRDGRRVFAGPLQGWQTSGEDLQLSCRGLLQYARSMVVHTDQVFTNVDQFSIVKTLVDQWQALPYGHFGLDTSKIGVSGQLRTVSYVRDELHVVGTRIEELGTLATGFDAEVDPASRELLLWSPGKGVDRSVGEDAIIFDSRNITSGDVLCSVAGGDLASEAYGNAGSAGADGALFSMASNEELRARYGRTGVTGSWSNEQEQTALDAYVQSLLDARAQALLVPGPRCRVTPDADLSAYAVGDRIAYDLAEQLGINQSFRIRRQTVTVSSTGQESVDLEFV